MNRLFSWPALVLLGVTTAASAQVPHVDILIYEQDGKLATGGSDFDAGGTPDGGVESPDTRVFSRELDLDGFTNLRAGDDPGFNSTPDFSLPANEDLYYRTVPFTLPTGASSRNLWYWDGLDDGSNGNYLDDVDFGAPPSGVEFARFNNGNREEIADGSDTTLPYVFIQTSNSLGVVHKHLAWGVTGDGYQSINVGGGAPPEGLYLVSFEFSIGGDSHDPLTDPENAEPIYIVFNNDADPLAEAAAVDWLTSELIGGDVLLGDYNGNGVVDAADYTVWQDSFGSTTLLDADGNGNGVVDAADYTVWQDNFGASAALSQGLMIVPEPNSLLIVAGLGGVALRRRKR
ncbi:PEP-CTERM sorting domain-containing protein [Algisphaera agarilytica]|uniref:PEP-CTERM protein-sorting domain-containing protein n=1 Tax=Algisphaera agarilytica TaxID=1385975 RepID=A0A7X0H612_9BACT|nr:PEP-CTERM sorting domain-containing protein [Algisphaera agarilytica]MBB6429889.1 hypothetical protein [Algisphaera agarilytica]